MIERLLEDISATPAQVMRRRVCVYLLFVTHSSLVVEKLDTTDKGEEPPPKSMRTPNEGRSPKNILQADVRS
ncbi:MAG: hypothetical protein HY232_07225 [Acidobacteria bacterium]|nr:hypothetical protein [Acidobacteriota bacterium]